MSVWISALVPGLCVDTSIDVFALAPGKRIRSADSLDIAERQYDDSDFEQTRHLKLAQS